MTAETTQADTFRAVMLMGGPAGKGRLFAVRRAVDEVYITPDVRRPAVLVRATVHYPGATRFAPAAGKTRLDGTPIWTPGGRWPA